ncbi:hypothetical protein BH09PSE6_BH09PSE6_17120 [soil metagenome]
MTPGDPAGEPLAASPTATTIFRPGPTAPTGTAPRVTLQPGKVLVVDDSRLVRASIIKQLRGVFDHVEAVDGLAAWDTLSNDPTIKVVVSDLTMPGLDGYQLLEKIRSSPQARIAQLPVVIISGNDEQATRAAEAGATEFITKGISATELLSRLDVLMRLSQQSESLRRKPTEPTVAGPIARPATFEADSERMWAFAKRHEIDIVCLCVRLDPVRGLPTEAETVRDSIRERVFAFVAEMLARTVRKEDCVARAANGEYLISTLGIGPQGAIQFATRLAHAIARARVQHAGVALELTASFGVAAASQAKVDHFEDLKLIAQRRAQRGQEMGGHRVVGVQPRPQQATATVPVSPVATVPMATLSLSLSPIATVPPNLASATISVADALALLAAGRRAEVEPHLPMLRQQLEPLLALLR